MFMWVLNPKPELTSHKLGITFYIFIILYWFEEEEGTLQTTGGFRDLFIIQFIDSIERCNNKTPLPE